MWGVDVNPPSSTITFDFDFQVWRPSPTVNETGCYSLVDSFMTTSISIPPEPQSNHVARVTPSPQDQLHFRPGDVLGFYVESHGEGDQPRGDDDNGVVLLTSAGYTSELVWHGRITTQTSQAGSCPYPVGTDRVLSLSTLAAPVISIKITTSSCAPNPASESLLSQSVMTPSHSTPAFIAIQSTPTKDIKFYPRNGSSISFRVLILGPLIILVGGIATVTVLVAVVIRMHKNSTNARHESDNRDQEVEYEYDYPAVSSAQSIKLKSNSAYNNYATHSDCNEVSMEPNVAYATHSTRL